MFTTLRRRGILPEFNPTQLRRLQLVALDLPSVYLHEATKLDQFRTPERPVLAPTLHSDYCWDSTCKCRHFETPLNMNDHIAVEQPSVHQSQSQLLNLPVEIRLQIYEYILTNPESKNQFQRPSVTILITPTEPALGQSSKESNADTTDTRLSIISASRQTYHDARSVLYRVNDFNFDTQFKLRNMHSLGYFAETIGPSSCSLVKSISIRVSFPSKDWSRVMFASLPYFTGLVKCRIMVLSHGLKQRVLRELIMGFVDFGSEWLVDHKEVVWVEWPFPEEIKPVDRWAQIRKNAADRAQQLLEDADESNTSGDETIESGPLIFTMQDFWKCFDEQLERKKAGLGFKRTALVKHIEKCLEAMPKELV
jgi:hypothetical protein